MKTLNRTNSQPQGLALLQALTAIEQPRIAVLDAELAFAADGWQQLLPAGAFAARDGRPFDVPEHTWKLDGQIAAALIAKAKGLGQDILIDYDHQTLRTDQNGQPAPAAGWFNADEIQWRNDEGLFIKPRWTARAAALVANGEYRFMSAVFPYDENGTPLELRMAAITNDPGVVGMQALAALSAELTSTPQTEPEDINPMNELLAKLLAKLGISAPENGQVSEDQAKQALDALDEALNKSKKAPELEQSVAALTAQVNEKQIDLAKYVPVETYNAVVTQVAALSAKVETTDAATLLKDAKGQGKVLAAEESYLHQFAQQKGVAALKALLDARPAIAALTARQTDTVKQPDQDKGLAVLTAEDKYAADQLGIAHADFAKLKETK
ncbi:I protein [Tolumonas auensis DSM 9187]|uniref:I protein n=1 Tax=Tolumonas auensis (strain DSM 9187 / NBRC 110442 / TA 4) TaxID=595494 RepID=C4LBD6_TOLAT|nr:phage protease [Tolumonas auensis]ACQ92371.1 I protein [Tolumonas auensis DSM 9187]